MYAYYSPSAAFLQQQFSFFQKKHRAFAGKIDIPLSIMYNKTMLINPTGSGILR
ncbi:MAG: hypothetical protein IJB85_01395 [Clostridia bacterium]|nr:hypothetical protein [Clostridia bacterium]